jgi:hypothetical protein
MGIAGCERLSSFRPNMREEAMAAPLSAFDFDTLKRTVVRLAATVTQDADELRHLARAAAAELCPETDCPEELIVEAYERRG